MRPLQLRLAAAAASLLLVGGLTGCAGGADATRTSAPTASGPPTSSADPVTASSRPSPSSPASSQTARPDGRITNSTTSVIKLTRRGGIGGMDDKVVVHPDGSYTVTVRGQQPVGRQLSESAMSALSDAARQARLADQARPSIPSRSDQLIYTMAVGTATLTLTEETAPASARALFNELNALFSEPGSRP